MIAEIAAGGTASQPAGIVSLAVPLTLSPYQPNWPTRYRIEAEMLTVALGTLTPKIEHCGSTAVPQLAARPVIDMLVGLPMPGMVDSLASRLTNYGYRLLSVPAAPDTPRILVRQVRGLLTHHVQIVESYSDAWHRVLLFRDLLREDPALAQQYGELKVELQRDRPGHALAYADGKSHFIASIVGY